MKPEPTIEPRVCIDCGREYNAQVYILIGARLVFGGGRCSECNGKKWAEDEAKEKAKHDAMVKNTRRLWRSRCGIPLKFQKTRFETFEKDWIPKLAKAFRVSQDFAEKFPIEKPRGYHSLFLFSEESWGIGKTHLACSIAHRIIDRWDGEEEITCPVKFISEPDLYSRITSTYDRKDRVETEADILKELIAVRLLIVDDIGKRSVVDPNFVQRIMFSIIDGRYKAMLPVVITSNLNPDELGEYTGGTRRSEATLDRIMEMCNRVSYKMEGKSYRSGV